MSNPNKEEKCEQCFCPSYYNDDDKLVDCKCDKCHLSLPPQKDSMEWEKRFEKLRTIIHIEKRDMGVKVPHTLLYQDQVKNFIRQEKALSRAEGYKEGHIEGYDKCYMDVYQRRRKSLLP